MPDETPPKLTDQQIQNALARLRIVDSALRGGASITAGYLLHSLADALLGEDNPGLLDIPVGDAYHRHPADAPPVWINQTADARIGRLEGRCVRYEDELRVLIAKMAKMEREQRDQKSRLSELSYRVYP